MNILDTRDLIEERNELKQQILDSFLETFEHYAEQTTTFEDILFEEEEIQSWREDWEDELNEIQEINDLEDEVGNEDFEFGVTLIDEDDFEEYCEEELESCGYFPYDLPSWIKNHIDWNGIAEDMKQDYSEVEYLGTTYLYRN